MHIWKYKQYGLTKGVLGTSNGRRLFVKRLFTLHEKKKKKTKSVIKVALNLRVVVSLEDRLLSGVYCTGTPTTAT